MALLVHDIECPSCRHPHDFGMESDRWQPGVPYEYVCPETAERSVLCVPGTAFVEGVPHWPQGAVPLTKKGTGPTLAVCQSANPPANAL